MRTMKLLYLEEPSLRFGLGQSVDDPRDGLALFGPLDSGETTAIKVGAVGTSEGIERFERWLERLQMPISSAEDPAELNFRPVFPGFQAVFKVPLGPKLHASVEIPAADLAAALSIHSHHERVYSAVTLYQAGIEKFRRDEERSNVDIWFIVVPPEVKRLCSPKSIAPPLSQSLLPSLSLKQARKYMAAPSLFTEINKSTIPYEYKPDFHEQIKARLLTIGTPIQLVQESTVAPRDFLNAFGMPKYSIDRPSTVAWNLSTAAYYKASGRPWKLEGIREGVCYLGIVFKRDPTESDKRNACCAAQLFLDSGDGVVFKGNVGPWYSETDRQFHLSPNAASEIVTKAIESYKAKSNGAPPSELFIHGKMDISEPEWRGFLAGASDETRVTFVKIRPSSTKVFGAGKFPLPRGTAAEIHARSGLLWTVGYVPRLQTFTGKEVPSPLQVDIVRGEGEIVQVLRDILALTKLNYNACLFGDGTPVTLRFADSVAEILTAGPRAGEPPLPFKFYI
jgi:hypothetical protein